MKIIISTDTDEAYLINENNGFQKDNMLDIIEQNIEPKILNEYLYVQHATEDDALIIPKGQKVYFLNEVFADDDDMDEYIEYLEDNTQYSKYPILVYYRSTGNFWITGPTDFDIYKQKMRDMLFRYSKSELSQVNIGDDYYIGILQPGLSILSNVFGEEVDLYPEYQGTEDIIYETNLPIESVLKTRSDPYPVYVDDELVYITPKPNAKIKWISGIFEFPPCDKDQEQNIKQQLEQMAVNPPRVQYTYKSDVDIY